MKVIFCFFFSPRQHSLLHILPFYCWRSFAVRPTSKDSTLAKSLTSDGAGGRAEKPKLLETRIFELKVRELNQTVDGLRKRKKIAIERLANTKKKLEEKDKAIAIVESNAKQLEERLKGKRKAAKECREKIQKIKADFDGVISEARRFFHVFFFQVLLILLFLFLIPSHIFIITFD